MRKQFYKRRKPYKGRKKSFRKKRKPQVRPDSFQGRLNAMAVRGKNNAV